MTFSSEWEKVYASQKHLSVWPWIDLVSLFLRHCPPDTGQGRRPRVLEFGCGAGANIPFFASLDVDYFAIEGSSSAVERLKKGYPQYADHIVTGDFTMDIPFEGTFDVVVDRGSLTHNTTTAIRRSLNLAHNCLNDDGMMIGIDWFSLAYSEFVNGHAGEDEFSRSGFDSGRLAGLGVAHFFDKPHLLDLLADFHVEVLEHKTVTRHQPDDGWQFGGWNFVARKMKAPSR